MNRGTKKIHEEREIEREREKKEAKGEIEQRRPVGLLVSLV